MSFSITYRTCPSSSSMWNQPAWDFTRMPQRRTIGVGGIRASRSPVVCHQGRGVTATPLTRFWGGRPNPGSGDNTELGRTLTPTTGNQPHWRLRPVARRDCEPLMMWIATQI